VLLGSHFKGSIIGRSVSHLTDLDTIIFGQLS
ncbi:uncharacterized protein METZ01_LOCUS265113, partial [marine metagenome]